MSQEDIIRKIQAMLAKAESTTHEAEAETFNAKAQELMLRHAIAEADLRDAGQAKKGEIKPEPFVYSGSDANLPGKRRLLTVACKMAGVKCVFYTGSRHKQTAVLIGYQADREYAAMIYASLTLQVTSLGRLAYNRDQPPFGLKRYMTGFMVGFGDRVAERAEQMTATVNEDTGGSLLPVLASKEQEVDQAFQQHFPNTKKLARNRVDAQAYGSGTRAGANADIGGRKVGGSRGQIS